ncbi:MAG: DEAD/DEAH box helicase [candidate division Zixibacteria bacterium]|nr:DEAD/DEAH box helicase [candidate division Zixibacteria bacterium]
MTKFSAFALNRELLQAVAEMGFTTPTPIQKDAIGPALEGRDILACAMTGSGKTAAFVLPILNGLMGKKRGTTRALILTPTRELAAQIAEHLAAMAAHTTLKGAAIYGGVSMKPQEDAFRRGVDVIVATPGRLLDHFQYSYAKLAGLEILVVDEADRMLDMGFLPDVRRILEHLPTPNQTLFFSATLPPPIVELSQEMLRNPVAINIDRKSEPAVGITRAIYPARKALKTALLLELLRRGSIKSALVFTRTKHRANRLALFLQKKGVKCERIHGNRSQNQRTEALDGFKNGRFQVLVATDIAARGIDVEALSHVVNFDVPEMADAYIHRVGRTARADAIGDAYTFVSPEEERDFREIEKALGKRLPRLTLDGFDYNAKAPEKLEIPIGERIAAIKAHRAEARANAERKSALSSRGQSESTGRSRPKPRPSTRSKPKAESSTPAPKPKPTGSGFGRRTQAGAKPSRRRR